MLYEVGPGIELGSHMFLRSKRIRSIPTPILTQTAGPTDVSGIGRSESVRVLLGIGAEDDVPVALVWLRSDRFSAGTESFVGGSDSTVTAGVGSASDPTWGCSDTSSGAGMGSSVSIAVSPDWASGCAGIGSADWAPVSPPGLFHPGYDVRPLLGAHAPAAPSKAGMAVLLKRWTSRERSATSCFRRDSSVVTLPS